MKQWLYVLVLGLSSATSTFLQADDKIAVVNVSSIFQQSSQRVIVAKKLENEFKSRASELQSMERDIQMKMHRLQRDGFTMKSSERSSLEKSLMTQRETFSTKAQEFEQDNHRRQTEERNKILSHIQDVVKNIATKKGYDIVIDTNAVAYSSQDKDITTDVMQQVK